MSNIRRLSSPLPLFFLLSPHSQPSLPPVRKKPFVDVLVFVLAFIIVIAIAIVAEVSDLPFLPLFLTVTDTTLQLVSNYHHVLHHRCLY
jgi:hypothetical protein